MTGDGQERPHSMVGTKPGHSGRRKGGGGSRGEGRLHRDREGACWVRSDVSLQVKEETPLLVIGGSSLRFSKEKDLSMRDVEPSLES